MVFDEEEEDFEGSPPPSPPLKIKCKYCGHILELREEIKYDPDTGEYFYICPNCAKRLDGGRDATSP